MTLLKTIGLVVGTVTVYYIALRALGHIIAVAAISLQKTDRQEVTDND